MKTYAKKCGKTSKIYHENNERIRAIHRSGEASDDVSNEVGSMRFCNCFPGSNP